MHWLDFVLLLVLAFGAFLGARSGLLWQVARVVTFILAIYACVRYHGIAAHWLEQNITGLTPLVSRLLSYVVVFLGVFLACFLLTYLLERGLRAAHLKPMDRLLGALVGALKAGLVAGAVLLGVALYSPASDQVLAESKVAPVLLRGVRLVLVAVPGKFKDDVSNALARLKKEGIEKAGETAGPSD